MRIKYNFSVFCGILIFLSSGFFVVSCKAGKAEINGSETPTGQAPLQRSTAGVDSENQDSTLDNIEEASAKLAALVLNMEEEPDIILHSYLDPALREGVVAFFRDITGSSEVAEAVLSNAVAFDIPPALAFALCWEESRYKPRAINRNLNDTVDRGLFQLNNASFPKLTVEDFYDPGENARLGLAHLRWCLNTAGTEVAGLAMYNAGTVRVRSAGTPKKTLDYISRILKHQRKMEELFKAEYSRIARMESADTGGKEKFSFRLSLLTPVGRN